MCSRTSRTLVCSLAVLAAGLMLAGAALAGPPWISIELPTNPHDPATRQALLVVHAYHHGANVQYPVTGTAEGLVDGERRSVSLTITETGKAGLYAVSRPRLDEGRWVLVIRLDTGNGAGATALVSLDGAAEVSGVRVPSDVNGEGWTIPRAVSAGEIDAILRRGNLAAADDRAGDHTASRLAGLAGLVGLLLVPIARRRRS
ncbi:MAG: hypothetical protein ACREK3_10400 [Gemmatimonadota bacterium]